jgi:hypothetical protein
MKRSQVFWGQSSVFRYFLECDWAKLFRLMPCPCVVSESRTFKPTMRRPRPLWFRFPANSEERLIDAICLGAWPIAHKNWIDFGGFLTCSVRSAITRRASAVTAISASFFVFPYAMTPGSSGTSANHRPSVSCSKSMRKDSLPSGGCGTVAITLLSRLEELDSRSQRIISRQRAMCQFICMLFNENKWQQRYE